jgi:hypothetical protein
MASLFLGSHMEGNIAIGEVSTRGGEVTVRAAVPQGLFYTEKEARKLAKLYAIDKMLTLADSRVARAVIPLPITAILRLVKRLVVLRQRALKGDESAKEAFSRALGDANKRLQAALTLLRRAL